MKRSADKQQSKEEESSAQSELHHAEGEREPYAEKDPCEQKNDHIFLLTSFCLSKQLHILFDKLLLVKAVI